MVTTDNRLHNTDDAEHQGIRHIDSVENVFSSCWSPNNLLQPRSFLDVFIGQLIEVTGYNDVSRGKRSTHLLYTCLNVVQDVGRFVDGLGRVVESCDEGVTADANPKKLIEWIVR